MRSFLFIALFTVFFTGASYAQTCSCSEVLNQVIWKTEHDYAGYVHKVKEKDSTVYHKLKLQLEKESAKTLFKACYILLQKYVDYFHDGHLYVGEFPGKQSDSLINTARYYTISANYEDALLKNKQRDEVEGIWHAAAGLELAVVKVNKNTFYGVVQKTTAPRWKAGMVKFELTKRNDGLYDIALYRNDFARIYFFGLKISKHTILSFGVYSFAKTFPVNAETKYIDPVDPQRPTLRALDKNNVLITIPSALVEERYLDSLIIRDSTLLFSTPNLIIDVRSNGGGNFIWGGIYEISNTFVKPQPKTSGDTYMLMASEDDANYIYNLSSFYRQRKNAKAIKYYDDKIAEIRSHLGEMLGFSFYQAGPDTATRRVYKYPEHIAVIIDKNVASAGEAFIQGLKETSNKVTLYGTNTHGMIDYMQVNTLPVGDKNCNWYYFGYPTYFSKDIKTKQVNPTGIKPNIYVPPNTPDWIQWVKNDMNKKL